MSFSHTVMLKRAFKRYEVLKNPDDLAFTSEETPIKRIKIKMSKLNLSKILLAHSASEM